MKRKIILAAVIGVAVLAAAAIAFAVSRNGEEAVEGSTYTNPILPKVADPDVLYWNGTYYLYPTTPSNEIRGFKVYTSTDLVNWTDKGMVLEGGPDNMGMGGFWAPDVIERDGLFYMYYTASERLGVSVSDSPLGPFKQLEYGAMHPTTPEIDAHAFLDDDGQYYLYFVRFDQGNVIFGAKLNDDMVTIDEDSIVEILRPSQDWERDMADINEGPFMLTRDGKYYLTYSGSHFESPMYGSGYAVGDSPLGPFVKYENNPIMQSNDEVHGAGHHGVTKSPDGTELWMVYHSHKSLVTTDPRVFRIDRMRFTEDDNGVTILEVDGPSITAQPVPSGAVDADNFIEIDREALAALSGGVASASDLPATIAIHTSKSDPEAPVEASIEWREEGGTAVGTISLPDGVTNLGDLSLTLEASIAGN